MATVGSLAMDMAARVVARIAAGVVTGALSSSDDPWPVAGPLSSSSDGLWQEKAREKWEETKEAARKEHTDLANQYTQEADAFVETLKQLDTQLEETAYEKDKASLELNKYKLGIFKGTDQEEELENKIYIFQTRCRWWVGRP